MADVQKLRSVRSFALRTLRLPDWMHADPGGLLDEYAPLSMFETIWDYRRDLPLAPFPPPSVLASVGGQENVSSEREIPDQEPQLTVDQRQFDHGTQGNLTDTSYSSDLSPAPFLDWMRMNGEEADVATYSATIAPEPSILGANISFPRRESSLMGGTQRNWKARHDRHDDNIKRSKEESGLEGQKQNTEAERRKSVKLLESVQLFELGAVQSLESLAPAFQRTMGSTL